MSTKEEIAAIYDRIKVLCKDKNVTQTDMCSACGMNPQSHRGRITKNVAPDVFDLLKIAYFLGTSVEYLMTGQESNPYAEENAELKAKLQQIHEISK